jgi:hypothetical protein
MAGNVSRRETTEKLHLIRWRNVLSEQLQATRADDDVNLKAIRALQSQAAKNTVLIRRLVAERDEYLSRLSERDAPSSVRVRLSRPIKNLEFALRLLAQPDTPTFSVHAVAPTPADSYESRLHAAENRITARDSGVSEAEAKYDECLRRIDECQESIGAAEEELVRNGEAVRDWEAVDREIHNVRDFLRSRPQMETDYVALQAELRELTRQREKEIAERNRRLDDRLMMEYVRAAADRDALAEEQEHWTLRVGQIVGKLTG